MKRDSAQGHATFHFDGQRIDVSPNKAFVISPDRRFYFNASHDYEQVLLRLDRTAIIEAWQRLTTEEQAPDICFDPVIPLHTAGWQALLPMLQWVGAMLEAGPGQERRPASAVGAN